MTENRGTVVLAYSGGLDTSCILVWLQEQGFRVVAFTADLGQEEDFEEAKRKATKLGATEVVVQDLRRELVEDFVWPAVSGGLIYEDRYLLGTALARPCITRALVALAKKVKAGFVSHGATGKGNDQIRFELACYTLCPDVEIIAPWKDPAFYKRFPGRPELFQYAKEHDIPLPVTPKSPWSMDANLVHISFESGVLEDPATVPPAGIFQMTSDPERAPDVPQRLVVTFRHGLPVSVTVDGEETITDALDIFIACNRVGAAHGVGRVDLVENRFLGLKSRGVYETPGLTLLHAAHQDLEVLCLDREVRKIKVNLSKLMAEQVYNGFWFSPEFEYTRQCVEASQKMVTGTVFLKVYKGNVYIEGRTAPVSLYNQQLVSMDVQGDFEPTDATGFIRLNALRLREHRRVKEASEEKQ